MLADSPVRDETTQAPMIVALREQLGKVIIGQAGVLDQALAAILADGHFLMVGVPGLAKTLLIRTLAGALGLKFHRIQFTPDLMPSDILGSEVLQLDPATGERIFRFVKGPVFANLILADEINRTPPKTQAALLEAMQERNVTVAGEERPLPRPFLVCATQNPIEQEGTYPLPEAQLDRFLLQIALDYPSESEERAIAIEDAENRLREVTEVATAETLRQLQARVTQIVVPDHIVELAVAITRATRPQQSTDDVVRQSVRWGAGPRAPQALLRTGRAFAFMRGSPTVEVMDVAAAAVPVLRHRVVLSYRAQADGVEIESLLRRILSHYGI